jgi:hypothetical protein
LIPEEERENQGGEAKFTGRNGIKRHCVYYWETEFNGLEVFQTISARPSGEGKLEAR